MACSLVQSSSQSLTGTQQSYEPTPATAQITLHKPATDKAVHWDEAVVDNEHLGKKTSKCCCIYHKPRDFDQPSSSSEDDSDDDKCGCHEHRVAKKKIKKT